MAANRSAAVMQQRHEPHDSLDDFPTPPWATRALCEWLKVRADMGTCREPAANRGHMARVLGEYFGAVDAADIFDYGAGFRVEDYLFGPDPVPVDWTITNPPFRLAEAFIARALRTSRQGVAVIVRTAFLEGQARFSGLFECTPPAVILQFSERVVMHKGRLAPKGSTATAYCWVIWMHGAPDGFATRFGWIGPCRARLERASDYLGGR